MIGAYEEERAEPRFEVLEVISDMFKVTLMNYFGRILVKTKGSNYLAKRRQLKMMSADRNIIHFVPVKAAAGYLRAMQTVNLLMSSILLLCPCLAGGNYRAFEIIGDSMMPTPSGSIIVGEKVESIEDAKSNMAHIVVSKNEGIVYKRIVKSNKNKNKITLVSDNPAYQPYQVNADDILEMWQAKTIINKITNQQRWDVNALANLVNNLQDQVSSMLKKDELGL